MVITYAALVGAVALGMALAFGLGGREVAGRILEAAYTKGERAKDDVIRDVRTGVQRGKAQASEAATQIEKPAPCLATPCCLSGAGSFIGMHLTTTPRRERGSSGRH